MEVETKYLLDKIKALEESVRILQNEVRNLKPKDYGRINAQPAEPYWQPVTPYWLEQTKNG